MAAFCIVAIIGLWPQTGILDRLLKEHPEWAPQFDAKSGPGAAARVVGTPVILNEADYEALPSGTRYIGPDGLTRQKR